MLRCNLRLQYFPHLRFRLHRNETKCGQRSMCIYHEYLYVGVHTVLFCRGCESGVILWPIWRKNQAIVFWVRRFLPSFLPIPMSVCILLNVGNFTDCCYVAFSQYHFDISLLNLVFICFFSIRMKQFEERNNHTPFICMQRLCFIGQVWMNAWANENSYWSYIY